MWTDCIDAPTLVAVARLDIGGIGKQLCDAAFEGVVKQLLEGYVVIGGTVAGTAGAYRGSGGIDLVWDLWNEQFSAFTYPEHALTSGSLAGATGGVHIGFGFGRFDSLHSAWSGEFYGVEYSVDIRAWSILSISGSVQGFASPDGSMKGGLVGIGGTAKVPGSVTQLLKLPLGGSVTAGGGVWTPHDPTTRRLAGRRSSDLVRGRYSYLNLEEGELGVGSHMLQVMGMSPLSLALAGYAVAVAMAKRNMEDKGITNREEGLRDLHLSLCSEAYRRISAYRQDVPSGTSEKHYGSYSVQRTNGGHFVITDTHSVPATGEWRSTRRLHRPDATVVGTIRYGQAIGGAPNAFIDGRSYPMSRFSQELERRTNELLPR